jgi:hypothetical protein
MAFTPEEFAAVKIGQRVGTVTGPCERPKDNAGTVTQKVEDRWGVHLVVQFDEDSRRGAVIETCHGFTKVGIGWYDLGYTAPDEKVPAHLRSLTGPWKSPA